MVTGSIAERLGAPVLGPENNQAAQKLAGFAERLIPVTLGAN
jgi:hypothetical protein